jgi:hypothetical protein
VSFARLPAGQWHCLQYQGHIWQLLAVAASASASFKLSLEISSCPDASSRHVDVVESTSIFLSQRRTILGLQGRLPF